MKNERTHDDRITAYNAHEDFFEDFEILGILKDFKVVFFTQPLDVNLVPHRTGRFFIDPLHRTIGLSSG